ncbi:hypothetical protein GCM10023232_25010 [Sphingosinicella ginsenosidimutans]|uniref:HTH luxR-type domain-containing protein n=1 Tax=Allosphingosinicella ginsenosidimutans TaxID=1176539 RepID=A0A5C6TVI6_9SPHN|nr:sigma factor-like helix-turn-helix DNA-binding protein [Sphingosinicella ginsenosidimutans]TXC63865.1 hypothetical protein FRZ32_09470 [Sphingosinicella ginsenosidimutans]
MEDNRPHLTEAQKEVLRLFHVRKSAKEIGRELNITHWAVNERLRSARRALRAASSAEAAERLARCESAATYNRIVCDPALLAERAGHPDEMTPHLDEQAPRAEGETWLREERVLYRHDPLHSLRLPLPRYRGEPNDLSATTRLKWIGALAFGIVLAIGALVSIAGGLLEIFSSLVGTL